MEQEQRSIIIEQVTQSINRALSSNTTIEDEYSTLLSEKDLKIKELSVKVLESQEKIDNMSSTMESQQKIIHDTIGQQMSLKKEFAAKDQQLNTLISSLQAQIKEKDINIQSLETQLKDSKSQLEKMNSIVSSSSLVNTQFPNTSTNTSLNFGNNTNASPSETTFSNSSLESPRFSPTNQSPASSIISSSSNENLALKDQLNNTLSHEQHAFEVAFSKAISDHQNQALLDAAFTLAINDHQHSNIVPNSQSLSPKENNTTNPLLINSSLLGDFSQEQNNTSSNGVISPEVVSAAVEKAVDIILSQRAAMDSPKILGDSSNIDINSSDFQLTDAQISEMINFNEIDVTSFSSNSQIPNNIINNEFNNESQQLGTQNRNSIITPPITPNICINNRQSMHNPSPLYQVMNAASPFSPAISQTESSFLNEVSSTINPTMLYTNDSPFAYPEDLHPNIEMSFESVPKKLKLEQEWTADEDFTLRKVHSLHGDEWQIVSNFLKSKTPEECSLRFKQIGPLPVKGRWTKAEDEALVCAYNEYLNDFGEITKKNSLIAWGKISETISGRSAHSCCVRYQESLDPTLKRGKWSPEEDVLLNNGYELYGKAWVKIAEMIPGRTQRQCRTRHIHLDARKALGNTTSQYDSDSYQKLMPDNSDGESETFESDEGESNVF